MNIFFVSKTLKIFMLLFAMFFNIMSFILPYDPNGDIFSKPPLALLPFFVPYILSYFYKITIDSEKIVYSSPFGRWQIKMCQIKKVRLIPCRGNCASIALVTKNGRKKEFEVQFFGRQEIWLALRENLQPYATHSKLPRTLLAGNDIEIN